MPKKAKKTKKTIRKLFRKTPGLESKNKSEDGIEGIKKTKIRVIGIGGGGGAIVSEIASKMKKVSFVVANTDLQALKTSSRKVIRFPFGQSLTHGLGTGMNPELGREAAQNEKDRIKKLLEGQDLCILVSCLGGGTSSGAVPVFAKISKNLGNLTYGIFTLPFKFEGEKKMEIARDSLKQIKNHLNAISLLPNERVFQIIDKTTPLKQALSVINKNLAESLGSLIETIYEPGLINIDFADFKAILEGKGRLAYLNTVEVQRKEGSTKDLATKVLTSPLYPYSIRGAKGVLFNIAGEKNLSLSEVNQISKTISDLVNPEAKIIFGISQSQKYSNTIKITLLATGCGMKIFSGKPKKKKRKRKFVKKLPIVEKKIKKRKKRKKEKISLTKNTPKPETKKTKKPKKLKTKRINPPVIKKPKKEPSSESETEAPKENLQPPIGQAKPLSTPIINEEKVRKNGLQIKKETEEIEQEIIEKEKFWETPAFLRRKPGKTQ